MQDLVVVIKDWCDEKFGYCWAGGKEYKRHMLSEDCSDGQAKAFSKSLSIASAVSMFSYRRYLTRKSCHANAPYKRWKVGFFLQHSLYIRLARRLQTTAHGINPAQENISLNMKNNIFTKNLLIW